MSDRDRQDRDNRIRGTLLGQACGDALGSGYEFAAPSGGHAVFKRGTFGHPPGSWTDDSEQAICVAQARSKPLGVAERLLSWYRGGPVDVGGTTRAVLSRAKSPAGMRAASRAYARGQAARPGPVGWDPGGANGSLMRTGPVCLPMLGDRERIAAVAREISDLTHYDLYCGDACLIWSLAIDSAVRMGGDFTLNEVRGGLLFIPAQRRPFWRAVIVAALDGPEPSAQNGSAVSAFKCALWAVAHAEGLEDGLQRAVSIGGDTDTVAAIAGALLGAIHGASAVPAAWRERVHGWPSMNADSLEELALAAAGVRAQPQVRPITGS